MKLLRQSSIKPSTLLTGVALILLSGIAVGSAVYKYTFNAFLDTLAVQADSVLAVSSSYVSLYAELRAEAQQSQLPVPAAYRAMVSDVIASNYTGNGHFDAMMVGMPEHYIETPPSDDPMSKQLEILAAGANNYYSGLIDLQGTAVLRTMFPSIADEQTCVDCHNSLHPLAAEIEMGDMLGAYVIECEVQSVKNRHKTYGFLSGTLTVFAFMSSFLFWTQHRALKEQALLLTRLSEKDSLTGCLNRRGLEKYEAQLAGKWLSRSAVLAIDIDHFKRINDIHGHQAGDEVLRQFAQTVRSVLRAQDVFGRIGGEEFLVYLVDVDEKMARAVTRRIGQTVASKPLPLNNVSVKLSVSIGAIYIAQPSIKPFQQLLKCADTALYKAKQQGRNRVIWSAVT